MFDQFSLREIWSVEDHQNSNVWSISRGTLAHLSNESHLVSVNSAASLFDEASSAARLHVHFSSETSSISVSLSGLPNLLTMTGSGTLNIASGCKIISNLPSAADLLFYLTEDTLWVWFDGVLLFDQKLVRGCLPTGANPSDVPWSEFEIKVSGPLTLSNIITLAQPQVTVEYLNAWGEQTQVVQLEDPNTALVSETIYDEMGRDAIKVKATRISRAENYSPLLIYYPDFVKNRYAGVSGSVFETGIVIGQASDYNPQDEGYPYSRTLYQDDMLREVKVEGMPGKAFSTSSTFTRQHGRDSGLPFLQVLFPRRLGFRETVTYEPNGSIKVSVMDQQENEVAEYVKVAGYDHILTIYEFDEKKRLVKMLPPNYHQKMDTFFRTTPWDFGDDKLTEEEIRMQREYGTHYQYSDMDQVVWKKAPDEATKGILYDPLGNIRFMYSINSSNETLSKELQTAEDIMYMLHSGQNKPVEIGFFQEPIPVATLMAFQNGTDIPSQGNSQIHQRIVYSDTHADPDVRGKVRLFLTYDDHFDQDPTRAGVQSPPHQELLKFNTANHVVMKTSNAVHTDSFTNYQKHYKGGKLREMAYPRGTLSRFGAANETVFNLIHGHDKMGRLTKLGTRTDPSTFAQIGYNAAGQVEQELVDPVGLLANFTQNRIYEYNAPGLLTAIRDSALTQQMAYIDGGYGQNGHGDGVLMNSVMSAGWSLLENLNNSQKSWFSIPQDDFADDKTFNMCINALKRVGIVDEETNIPVKFLTRALLSELPLLCSGSTGLKLMEFVAKYLPPTSKYGHSYNYGNHQELVKAKYFGDDSRESTLGPLKVVTFSEEITELESSLEESEIIWNLLVSNGYVIVDGGNTDDKMAAIGKQGGNSFLRYTEMAENLREVDPLLDVYTEPILKLLYKHLSSEESNKEIFSLEEFQDIYVNWLGYMDTPTAIVLINIAKREAASIYAKLEEKQYFAEGLERILTDSFVNMFSAEHKKIIGKICGVLTAHFNAEIGGNIFDFESYSIDPNGNRQVYFSGLHRHELEYEGATNRVKRLKVRDPYGLPGEDEKITEFEHDNAGNVIKAEHKGVKLIRYHPVIQRPMLMELEDGRRIVIRYDAQGERLLKRVFGVGNKLLGETKYLRDENGRVLMDKLTKFGDNGEIIKQLETTYLYGPRDFILGFIRNGKFYSVFTDHAGSARLITQGGKVVAGYDFWPYGEMIRCFGDEDAHLTYRFTNQEYDEETGLYNYHARLYDPTIGRFFQPDPKSQYFSPYVYGGNSPVSLVDPDGEFFFLLFVIIGAIVGGFLAGATANGNWNPAKWNWKSAKTWMAIIGGAIGGAMLPGSLAGLTAANAIPTLLVGLVGSYLNNVKQSGSWNPGDWDWASPATYNAFFEGFSSAVAMTGPVNIKGMKGQIKGFFKSFSKTGHKLMLEVGSGVGFAVLKGAMANDMNFKFWEWDWMDPATYATIKDGFMTGKGFPNKATKAYKGFADTAKKMKTGWKAFMNDMRGTTKKFMKDIFKNPKHPLWKTLGKAVLSYVVTGMDQGNFDFTKWDWKSLATYESVLNNYKLGSELKKMKEDYSKRDWLEKGIEFAIEEIQKHVELHPVLELIFDNVDSVFEFYDQLERYWGSNGTMPFNKDIMVPVALQMYSDLKKRGVIISEEEEDTEFAREMQQIMDGLRAGSSIFPVFADELAKLIDCESSQGYRNGTMMADGSFEKCLIGSGGGKISRQNRELVKKIFQPSRLYQSKNEFVAVKESDQPEEFGEHVLKYFGEYSSNEDKLFESFFHGAIYHSLLNVEPIRKRKTNFAPSPLYFLEETVSQFGLTFTHMAMITEKQGENILVVRTITDISADKFSQVKGDLTTYLKNIQYHCYLPASVQVEGVEGESIAMVTSTAGTLVYQLTPDYSISGSPCSENGNQPKFVEIAYPTGNIFSQFDRFVENGSESEFQKLVEDMQAIHQTAMTNLQVETPFIGFVYGLLLANMKETFDVSIERPSAHLDNLLFVAQRNSNGAATMNGTPAVITTKKDWELGMFPYLHRSTLLSLSKEALIASVDATSNDNVVVAVDSQTLPKFTSIFTPIFEELSKNVITNIIKFIYYNHHAVQSAVATPPTTSENSHIISNFLLGDSLSRMEANPWEAFVFIPSSSSNAQLLKSQRLFVLRNPETSVVIVLNVIESSVKVGDHYEFDTSAPTDIPFLPDVDISQLQMVLIKLNSKSVSGWSTEEAEGDEVTAQQTFFQGVTVSVQDHRFIDKDNAQFLPVHSPIPSLSSTGQLSFSKAYITGMMEKLKENRLQLLVNQSEDFESVVMGLLMGASAQIAPDSDGISMTLRRLVTDKDTERTPATAIPAGVSLLSLSKDGVLIPQTEQVLLASLKTIEEGDDVGDGGEELIERKLKEAKQHLKEYHCSRETRLKQAFKVSDVPAVYDSGEVPASEGGDRVRFEVDPEDVVGNNCTAAENPFQEYLKKNQGYQREKPFESQKGEGIFDFFRSNFNKYFWGNGKPAESKSIPNSANLDGCHLGAWVSGEGYSVDGITCTSGKSKMAVFRHVQENDMVTASSRGMPFNLVGDNYVKEQCSPLTWNGKPSISCKGEKTTLIYTPYYEHRLFDELDGNLMLGRVALHMGGKLWSFVRNGAWKSHHDKVNNDHVIPEEMMMGWEREAECVRNYLGKWEGSQEDVKWAQVQLEECQEMLQGIRQSHLRAMPETIENITERLEALQEDLAEQILYVKMGDILESGGSEDSNLESDLRQQFTNNNFYTEMHGNTLNADMGSSFNFSQNSVR